MDKDGELKRPVMVHRAIFGSVERFFGILIEHFAGRFPLWISPLQVRVLSAADRHEEYALEVEREMTKAGLICDVDATSESINKKVRNAQLMQVNYILTVGDKEVENKTVALRTRDNVLHGEVKVSDLIASLCQEKKERALHSSFAKEEKHEQNCCQ